MSERSLSGIARGWLEGCVLLLMAAAACAGVFFGAALYINLVEHPARVSCGPGIAVREFAPSYKRATVMQASLAVTGFVTGLFAAWLLHDSWIAVGASLLGAVVPVTLVVIFPTNKQLLDPALDAESPRASRLLARWNRLHAVRTVLSAAAFVVLLFRIASHGAA